MIPLGTSGRQFSPGIPAAVCPRVLFHSWLVLDVLGLVFGKAWGGKALGIAIRN